MAFEIGHIDVSSAGPAPRLLRAVPGPPAERQQAPAETSDVIPESPPAEVSEAVAAAADRVRELAAEDRELHFTVDEDSGRVVIEVRTLDGVVIRTISPSQALDLMSGGPL